MSLLLLILVATLFGYMVWKRDGDAADEMADLIVKATAKADLYDREHPVREKK